MQNKPYDVYGIGNGILDLLVEVGDQHLENYGLEKASMRLVEASEQLALLEKIESHQPVIAAGGSVANSIALLAQLGARVGLGVSLGDDSYGDQYSKQLSDMGVVLPRTRMSGTSTGTSLVMVTPDAERTMRTCLAAAGDINFEFINQEILAQSQWVFLEGYLFANPGEGPAVLKKAAEFSRSSGTKVAVTLSEAWVVDTAREHLQSVVEISDLVFCNEAEACTYARTEDPDKAFATLSEALSGVIMTRGEKGVLVRYGDFTGAVDAFASNPVDLTGAGDALAGGFLYGICKGKGIEESARAGCYFAHRVISQMGARLAQATSSDWEASQGRTSSHA